MNEHPQPLTQATLYARVSSDRHNVDLPGCTQLQDIGSLP